MPPMPILHMSDEFSAEAIYKMKAEQNIQDREKLIALAATIRAFQVPTATTQEGKDVVGQVAEQFEKLAIWLTRKAGEL